MEFTTGSAAPVALASFVHRGALVEITANQLIPGDSQTYVAWDQSVYDTGFDENFDGSSVPNFWLGPDIAFDGATAVDPGTDRITVTGHGLVTGMGPYTLDDNGNTAPTGLTDGTNYWVIRVDNDTIELADSRANALTSSQVDITADGSGTINLNGSTRLMVPAGVAKVRVAGLVAMEDGFAGTSLDWEVHKNGSGAVYGGIPRHGNRVDGTGEDMAGVAPTPTIEVVEGDFFELQARKNGATARNMLANRTWMALEVVETDTLQVMAEPIDAFFQGTVADAVNILYKKVAARAFALKDDMSDGEGHAETAPSGGAAVFDVARNGTNIGTITFADGSNTSTFLTTGSGQEDFAVGDRLTISSQATMNGIGDVAIGLFGFR